MGQPRHARQWRSERIVTAWIATFAILMAALFPSLSSAFDVDWHGLQGAHGAHSTPGASSWTEICSSMGIKMVEMKTDTDPEAPTPGKLALHAEHCPFCSLHAGAMGMPPSFKFIIPAAGSASSFPSLFYQTPTLQYVWSSAQSRAPPVIS